MITIPRLTADLSHVTEYEEGEHDRVIRGILRKSGLWGENFLYSVFDHESIDRFLASGFTRDPKDGLIYAFTSDEFVWDTKLKNPNCIRTHAKGFFESGVAVYHAHQLSRSNAVHAESKFAYEFVDPGREVEAVAGVLELVIE